MYWIVTLPAANAGAARTAISFAVEAADAAEAAMVAVEEYQHPRGVSERRPIRVESHETGEVTEHWYQAIRG